MSEATSGVTSQVVPHVASLMRATCCVRADLRQRIERPGIVTPTYVNPVLAAGEINQSGFRGALMRLMVPEKVSSGRPALVSVPRRNRIERPARTTSPWPSISSPS
jgi:hypothetical protein